MDAMMAASQEFFGTPPGGPWHEWLNIFFFPVMSLGQTLRLSWTHWIGILNYNIPVTLAATTQIKKVSAVPSPKSAKVFDDANTPKVSRIKESETQMSRTIGDDGHGHIPESAQ